MKGDFNKKGVFKSIKAQMKIKIIEFIIKTKVVRCEQISKNTNRKF